MKLCACAGGWVSTVKRRSTQELGGGLVCSADGHGEDSFDFGRGERWHAEIGQRKVREM